MSDVIFQFAKPWTIVRFASNALTDSAHIERVNAELEARIEKLPLRAMLLINFRGVEFVSSQVLGLLLNAKSKIAEKSGKMVICRVSTKLREAMEITGLIKQFTIEESESAVVGTRPSRRAPQAVAEVGWVD